MGLAPVRLDFAGAKGGPQGLRSQVVRFSRLLEQSHAPRRIWHVQCPELLERAPDLLSRLRLSCREEVHFVAQKVGVFEPPASLLQAGLVAFDRPPFLEQAIPQLEFAFSAPAGHKDPRQSVAGRVRDQLRTLCASLESEDAGSDPYRTCH